MKTFIRIVLAIVTILIVGTLVIWFGFLRPEPPPISEEDRARISIMPLPASLELKKGSFQLDGSLRHEFTGRSSPRLDRAVRRFYSRLTDRTNIRFTGNERPGLILHCSGKTQDYPLPGDDESYTIRIRKERITVTAPEETGLIYGLESLLQLLSHGGNRWSFPALKIEDSPAYPWRGLMIDACRHWIPGEVIRRNLDAMAALKMNVLHWHLTEYQGFRVESGVYPDLHRNGSGGNYYSKDEIREIIEYAADRGIRVVPEFDLPGHSTSWFVGYPELASAPGPYTLDTVFGILDPVMDPSRESVYTFLEKFMAEMAGLFPDPYIHIGGDEVNPDHWYSNPGIVAFMEQQGLEDHHELQAYFNIRMQKILASQGKKMMGWDEIIHPDLPEKGIAVQTWRDHTSLWTSARKGYPSVLSAGYYLDHKQPASFHYQVDPLIIPGAVNIEIDSSSWEGWQCNVTLDDMVMEGSLYIFGEGETRSGIFEFMGGSSGFTDAVVTDRHIGFNMNSNFGDIRFDLNTTGDSIQGTATLSFLNLDIRGSRSGGAGMEKGDPLPDFKRIEPLTPEQEKRILGGEACMWTEMVDARTIDSRIWPRAGAIAEKLWSPRVLTGNTGDMYRRLMTLDRWIGDLGIMHKSYRDAILEGMVPERYLEPLRILVRVLQEDKFFNRMTIYEPELYTTTPLNRVVDAAPPESYVAYRFGRDVDEWLESADPGVRARLIKSLEKWEENHNRLAPAFELSERLREVEFHSINLSGIASLGLKAIEDPSGLREQVAGLDSLFTSASKSYGGTVLPLTGPVRKLVEAAASN